MLTLLSGCPELCTMLPAAAGDGAALLMLRLLPADPCLLLTLAGLPSVKLPRLDMLNSAVESMARKALIALLLPAPPCAGCRTLAAMPPGASTASHASTLRLAFFVELDTAKSISSAGCFMPDSVCPAACAAPDAVDVAAAGLSSLLSALPSGGEKGRMAFEAKGDPLLVSETCLPAATSSASSLRLMALMVIFCSLTPPAFTMLPDTEPERPTGGGVTMLSSSGEGGGIAGDWGEAWAGLAGRAGELGAAAAAAAALRCGLACGAGDGRPGPRGFLSLLTGVGFLALPAWDGLGCVAVDERTLVAAARGVLVLLPSLVLAKAAPAVLVTSGDVVVLPRRPGAASATRLLPCLVLGGV